jgi:hypothetical protein
MSYAALHALGTDDGIASVEWFRRMDGSAVVSRVASLPPDGHVFRLLGLSHGADMHRAWANAVVNGVFGPIPRVYASGVAFLRGQGNGGDVKSVEGWEVVREELGDLVVEAMLPMPGQARAMGPEGEGYVIVRHAETARVDAALEMIRTRVQVMLG